MNEATQQIATNEGIRHNENDVFRKSLCPSKPYFRYGACHNMAPRYTTARCAD